ncbi:MAG: hypothetical protein FJ302_11865 [Planctomycetes bacterium]|nr:hypothetical protein [Planctomycetota bacterium]
MADSELAQIGLFAEIDELVRRLRVFVAAESAWEPLGYCQAIVRRLLGRVETLRIRLEAPLVVVTFGGTGVGKSSLVNALVGRECTRTGRERPTTTLPVLIAHPDTNLDSLGLPLSEFELVRIDSPILRDIVVVDCPDPDTSEAETADSNLARLRKVLPHCDVLLLVSTQQKYRSARVRDELRQAAEGCRLLFVQTHADHDSDIREDWRRQLAETYAVPEVFFVDSVRALQDQQAGRRPSGDFARLQDLLTSRVASSQRLQVRRANLLDLIHVAIAHCREHVAANLPAIEKLEAELEIQRQRLHEAMTARLRDELVASQGLWERRLLTAVTERWGVSLFSSMLRVYSGLGNLIASATLWRARSSVQMALIGVVQGSRWLSSKQQEREAETSLQRAASSLGLEDDLLRESQLVLSGFLRDARLTTLSSNSKTVQELRQEAARVEGQFLGDAGQRIDGMVEEVAKRRSGKLIRMWYETLLLSFVGFVLYRVLKSFFYDSMFADDLRHDPYLSGAFYINAGVIFLLWTTLLVMMFTRRLRGGLQRKGDQLAAELARQRTSEGLFPACEEVCRGIHADCETLVMLAEKARSVRERIARPPQFGAAR